MNYLEKFKKLDIKTKKMISSHLAGNFKSAFKGKGLEFEEFREYESGEDSKYIDWLVSAREQRLLTKKFSIDKSIKVFFVLDITESMKFGFDKKKLDTLIEIFFLLAMSSSENGDQVGALIFNENNNNFFATKKGKAQIFEIYKRIVENENSIIPSEIDKSDGKIKQYLGKVNINNKEQIKEESSAGQFGDLNSTFSFLNKIKLKNTMLFVLTDKMDVENNKNLKILALKNDLVYVNIFDNFENTLDAKNENSGILGFLSPEINLLYIDNLDVEKKNKYKELRKSKIVNLSKYLNNIGASYLKIDNLSNIYKEFFNFFSKK